MILLSEKELKNTRELVERGLYTLEAQRAAFLEMGATPEQAEHGLGPMQSFVGDLQNQIADYEMMKRGEIQPASAFVSLGRQLIALRLARGWSQQELASHLGISAEEVVSDEINEYRNTSPQKAQRVLDALGGKVEIRVELGEMVAA